MSARIAVPLNDLGRHIAPVRTEIAAAVARVIASGRYILGESCAGFEAAFAEYCGTAHCIGVANGTDALELTIRALGMKSGARIATVANAGMYATTAILAAGVRPVFIDIDPITMTMSPAALAAAGPVDAIVVTHLYGRMADMPALLSAAKDTPMIEDCAQAHGAALDGRRAGSWGIAGCFSFYPTKNLGALGDGGAVTTGDPRIAGRVKQLRQYGWAEKYHAEMAGGRNSRLDEIQAAVLSVMLPGLDENNSSRRRIMAAYIRALSGLDARLPDIGPAAAHVGHLFVMRSKSRAHLMRHLKQRGVATDIHYPVPDYRQPAVVARLGRSENLPETEAAAAEVLTLPCFPELTDAEIQSVAAAIRECMP